MILTVQQHSNGKFRLGISKENSVTIFKKRYVPVALLLTNKVTILTKTTCGRSDDPTSTTKKKGFDLCDPRLSDWIIENGYHKYDPGRPTKLFFDITMSTAKNPIINLKFRYALPKELQYHKEPLQIIKDLEKPILGALAKKSSPIDGLKAEMKPVGNQFSIYFHLDAIGPRRKKLSSDLKLKKSGVCSHQSKKIDLRKPFHRQMEPD